MKHYIVYTHLGQFETCAVSPRRAIANVRYRIAGRGCGCDTSSWEVAEVA